MMIMFYCTFIFVLSMISLTLSLATVTKNQANADTTMKLHIFFVQAIVVLSALIMFCSGYAMIKTFFYVISC